MRAKVSKYLPGLSRKPISDAPAGVNIAAFGDVNVPGGGARVGVATDFLKHEVRDAHLVCPRCEESMSVRVEHELFAIVLWPYPGTRARASHRVPRVVRILWPS
jgi:hypothetical protein